MKIRVNNVKKIQHYLSILKMNYIEITFELNMINCIVINLIDYNNNFNYIDIEMMCIDRHFIVYNKLSNTLNKIHVVYEFR